MEGREGKEKGNVRVVVKESREEMGKNKTGRRKRKGERKRKRKSRRLRRT